MIRIIVEVLLALALIGSSTFGWMQYKSVGASTSQVSELEDKTAEAEKKLGLARLFVAAGRNDQDGFTVVISQQYGLGAFVIDSAILSDGYWKHLDGEDHEN